MFEGAFERNGDTKDDDVVISDGYVRVVPPKVGMGDPGAIFLGVRGYEAERQSGEPEGLADFCMTSWCATTASRESSASGEAVYGGFLTTSYGACVHWERTSSGPLRVAMSIAETGIGGHTVLECPETVTDPRSLFNGTLSAVSDTWSETRWPCLIARAA